MGRKFFLAALALAFLYVISPLLLPVVMGGVLAVLFIPALARLEKRRVPRHAAAALLTVAVTLLFLIPTSFLVFAGAKSGMQQLQSLQAVKDAQGAVGEHAWIDGVMAHPTVQRLAELASRWLPISPEEFGDTIRDLAAGIGRRAAALLGKLLGQLPGMALDLVLVVVSLFFFLADGRGFLAYVRGHSFLGSRETEKLLESVTIACRSVVLASVAAALVQALIELVAVWIADVPNPALVALLVFVSAFVPVIGSAPVTVGVAVHQLLTGRTGVGIALLIVALVVSTVDNVVRALFLRGSADLHPMIAFMAALGGLQILGFPGVFLGPIVAVVFMAVLDMKGFSKAG